MTLAGGPADKVGNRYELKWTAHSFARVLLGEADQIRLEPPRLDSAEFWIEAGGVREYHQVKRQQTNAAGWTLAALKSEGVLAGFRQNLNAPNAQCKFISTNGAAVLQKLTERARGAANATEFRQCFTQDKDSRTAVDLLVKEWSCTENEVYAALRRIHVVTEDEASLDNRIRLELRLAVNGNIEAAVACLVRCGLENVHKTLAATNLWVELGAVGVRPSATSPESLEEKIRATTAEYLANVSFVPILARLCRGKRLPKSVTSFVRGTVS